MENKKFFKCAIFDFDGVIIDTEKYHHKAWHAAFAYFGIEFTWNDYVPLKSTGRKFIISYIEKRENRIFSESEKQTIEKIKDEVYTACFKDISENDFTNGVIDFLEFLLSKNIKTGVASSSRNAKDLIDKFNLGKYFNVVIDGTNVTCPKKPNPDIFIEVARRLNMNNYDCVVFEDSYAGFEAAIAGGFDLITIGELHSDSALLAIDDFTDIQDRRNFLIANDF